MGYVALAMSDTENSLTVDAVGFQDKISRARIILEVMEPLSVVLLFVFWLSQSWLRWSDPLIDFPKNLYIAWRMVEGDLLYDKLANWYGPLSHLVEALGFRIFGVGLDTLVWMNIALTVAVLWLLRAIFRELGGRLSAWLGSVAFLTIFAFSHSRITANYNFITPYASQAVYSFLGLLLVLWGLLRYEAAERSIWLGVAGCGLAVAYLDKPEAVLAAGGALAVYLVVHCVRLTRAGSQVGPWLRRVLGWLAGGFLSLWLPVLAYFSFRGGLAYGWRATNYVAWTVFEPKFLRAMAENPMIQALDGLDRPGENFLNELHAGLLLALLCGAVVVGAGFCAVARDHVARLAWLAVMLLAVAVGGLWSLAVADIGAALVFPGCIITVAFIAGSLQMAWRGRPVPPRVLGHAVVGTAACLMLARIFLQGHFGHYGFFMMPLLALFGIDLLVVATANPYAAAKAWTRWLGPAAVSFLILADCAALGATSLGFYARKTYEVGRDRDHFYTFEPKEQPNGWLLNTMVKAFREQSPTAGTLLALPEGIAVNYHLRVPSPLAEMEFQPLSLHYMDTAHLLDELREHPPAVVFLFHREMSEYQARYFGETTAGGRDILEWLDARYGVAWKFATSGDTITGDAVDLALPKIAGRPLPSLLPPGR